jgi:AcrR family transcriptional regulator
MEYNDKEEHILQMAEHVFAKFGYNETSIRRIAKGANVNLAMVHYYFGTKEKLLYAVVDAKMIMIAEILHTLDHKDAMPYQRLHDFTESYADLVIQHMGFYWLLLSEYRRDTNDATSKLVRNFFRDCVNNIKELLQGGIESGEFKMVDTEVAGFMILSTITNVLISPNFSLEQSSAKKKARIMAFLDDYFIYQLKRW